MSQYYVTERQVRKHITILRQRKNGEYVTVLRHRKIGEYIADFYDKKKTGEFVTGLCHRKIIEYIAVPGQGNTGERTLKIICHSSTPGEDRENM